MLRTCMCRLARGQPLAGVQVRAEVRVEALVEALAEALARELGTLQRAAQVLRPEPGERE